jgi:hypothetical protein
LNGAACGEVPNTAVVVAAPATGNAEGNAAPPVIEASKVVPVGPTAIKR